MTFVLICGITLLVWERMRIADRIAFVAEAELDKAISEAGTALSAEMRIISTDVLRESAWIEAQDTLDLDAMLARWVPLMRAEWGYLGIKLADENGDELSMCRRNDKWLLIRTVDGSRYGPPLLYESATGEGGLAQWDLHLSDSLIDPRAHRWYSKTLNNAKLDPVISENTSGCTGNKSYTFSWLIRSNEPNVPFRILVLEVDPLILPLGPVQHFERSPIVVLFDSDGRPFPGILDGTTGPLDPVIDSLSARGKAELGGAFQVEHDGRTYLAKVRSIHEYGADWSIGASFDTAHVAKHFKSEEQVLLISIVLMALLASLFIWTYFLRRGEEYQRRLQDRFSRTQERKLAKAIGEREVLNQEVHHRVKNNLQVVSSLLNLQAMQLEEGPVKEEFMRSKKRIDSMALVHHKLYALQDLRGIDLHRFFTELLKALAQSYAPRSSTVSYEVDTDAIVCDPDTAIELGIIVSELIGNCYTHAFPYATGGHIEVVLRGREQGLYHLTVQDNGQGYSDQGTKAGAHLGLEVVQALAEQLDGSFTITTTDKGTKAEVTFRMKTSAGNGPKQPAARP